MTQRHDSPDRQERPSLKPCSVQELLDYRKSIGSDRGAKSALKAKEAEAKLYVHPMDLAHLCTLGEVKNYIGKAERNLLSVPYWKIAAHRACYGVPQDVDDNIPKGQYGDLGGELIMRYTGATRTFPFDLWLDCLKREDWSFAFVTLAFAHPFASPANNSKRPLYSMLEPYAPKGDESKVKGTSVSGAEGQAEPKDTQTQRKKLQAERERGEAEHRKKVTSLQRQVDACINRHGLFSPMSAETQAPYLQLERELQAARANLEHYLNAGRPAADSDAMAWANPIDTTLGPDPDDNDESNDESSSTLTSGSESAFEVGEERRELFCEVMQTPLTVAYHNKAFAQFAGQSCDAVIKCFRGVVDLDEHERTPEKLRQLAAVLGVPRAMIEFFKAPETWMQPVRESAELELRIAYEQIKANKIIEGEQP